MVDPNDDPAPEARPPGVADLVALCRSLNREGARYVVVGGMAIIQAGFVRATEDIDLLVDSADDNVRRLERRSRTCPIKPCWRWQTPTSTSMSWCAWQTKSLST